MKIIQPEFGENSFTCPYCQTLAQQNWDVNNLIRDKEGNVIFYDAEHPKIETYISVSTCNCCGQYHLWKGRNMLIPDTTVIPLPNEDMSTPNLF